MIFVGDKKFLNTKEASKHFGLSMGWFRKKRFENNGPPYMKLPRSATVFYEIETTEKWFLENMREE